MIGTFGTCTVYLNVYDVKIKEVTDRILVRITVCVGREDGKGTDMCVFGSQSNKNTSENECTCRFISVNESTTCTNY